MSGFSRAFQLKAIEEKSEEHHEREVCVRIISSDVNDCVPVFINTDDGKFHTSFREDIAGGSHIMQIKATDADVSPEYGNASIKYG